MKRLDYFKLSSAQVQAMFALEKAAVSTELDKHLTDLVRIRASQLNGCLLCIDMHTKEAYIHEERPLRLHHLVAWRESPLFSEREKAALEWTEILTKIDHEGVSDEAYESACKHFSEKELSDLTFVISNINAWNRLGVAFRNPPGSMDKVMGLDKAGLS